MKRLLARTSITIDEAVAILLGRTDGPIDLEPIDGAEDSDEDAHAFCLREELEDELERLAGEYAMAKHANQAAHVVADKLAALQLQEALLEQANHYLCAIQDELNKGEASLLRLNDVLTNATYTYITLHSFNEWRRCRDSEAGRPPGTAAQVGVVPVSVPETGKKDRTRLRQQEDAILDEIRRQKHDPMALPPIRAGHPGVKADVREALRKSPLFKGSTIFDKAWKRLREQDCIRETA